MILLMHNHLGTSYLCVTLLSNLIYLAFRELVSLRVGCVTMWSRGSHHSVSELGSINQVISFWNFRFLLIPQKKFLTVQFLLLLDFAAYKKKISYFKWKPEGRSEQNMNACYPVDIVRYLCCYIYVIFTFQ